MPSSSREDLSSGSIGRGNGEIGGAQVGAEEDRGGADVEEDDGVVIESDVVGEIDGDIDLAAGTRGMGGSGPHGITDLAASTGGMGHCWNKTQSHCQSCGLLRFGEISKEGDSFFLLA
ncbi:hypothetical protein CMV_030334 [Castanea mollissima]|uniref:Uncharacterized protein n=1 Tax=Castanea mollissima TaxID=60419 RepID=A0A8J4Q5E3_9ROSI|nr:hypothetical protein CMV_030334 [Castanea mollissima]